MKKTKKQDMHTHKLSYILKQDGNYFVGRVRELPAVFEQGQTRNSLERKLKSGIVAYLSVSEKDHKKISKSATPQIRIKKYQYGSEGKILGVRKLSVTCS